MGAEFEAEMKCFAAQCNVNNPLCEPSIAWLGANQVCINDLQLPVDQVNCDSGLIEQTVVRTAEQRLKDKKRANALGKLQ